MSLLFAGSSSDLNIKSIKKLGIECVHYPYKKNGKVHIYEEDFDFDGFFSKLKKGSNFEYVDITAEEYIQIFEPCFLMGDDVIFVHSSEKIKNVDGLKEAKLLLEEKYPDRRLELIDSKNISIGEGLVTYGCAMLYRKGESINSIVEKSIDIINESAFFFVTNSSRKLEENNIVSDIPIAGGTMLNIKNIWNVNIDGQVELYDKVSGKKKAVSKLLDIIRQLGENVADYPIGIVYTGDEVSANELKEKIISTFDADLNIHLERLTPNNAMLLGDDVLGLAFHIHRKLH